MPAPPCSLRGIDLDDVAGLLAAQLGVGPFRDAARPDLVHEVVGAQPLGDLAAAHPVHVDGDEITVPSWSFDLAQLGELLPEPVDAGIDLELGRLDWRNGDDEALIARYRDLRAYLHHGVESESAGVLAGCDVDLRGSDRVERCFLDGLGVVVRQCVPDHLGADRLGSEADLEQPPGDLAGAEAGHADFFLQPAEGLVDCGPKLLLVDLDGELDSVALEGLGSGAHRSWVLYRPYSAPAATPLTACDPMPGAAGCSGGLVHPLEAVVRQ